MTIIINKDSIDKDAAMHPIHYIALDGVIIYPVAKAGEVVREGANGTD